ncbi:SEC-C domain-containing protein, partial [candidate division KSB1 bacterium]|nr:SEC-C domain-containing protein [candidate division KSB1 bacterium]
ITHPMISKSIERAQKRVEMRNFDIRKHLLEYDDVMTKQREVIYTRRRRALVGENLQDEIRNMIEDYGYNLVEQMAIQSDFGDSWDWDALQESLLKTMLLPLPISNEEKENIKSEDLSEKIVQTALEGYERKRSVIGDDLMAQLERFATLRTIDERWKEHLYEMDRLREGIGLRAYGQKDPLMEYKQEGFRTFREMLGRVNQEILEVVFKAQIQVEQGNRGYERERGASAAMAMVHEETAGMGFAGSPDQAEGQESRHPRTAGKRQPVHVDHKVGRNDPCTCGSGKKYKHCHGRSQAG